jgi:Zn finger protein HypA/HybF involved in hydrogenase expression
MKLKEYYQEYKDETSCKLKFKVIRDQQGVICKKCGGKEHYWHENIWEYECKKCKFRTTLRSGTVMEDGNGIFNLHQKEHLRPGIAKGIGA